ncbi:MAG: copper resistance protein CopA [Hyphomonas sp.]|uniref:copper resistance system multicopper oxidase n=1 Tax=Hyphomonas sp. TaxID=87 RepID=UPI001D24709F|nr:copper resistance system multicopper oxidase [Hyphomonas sp.]MBA4228205.1 copper resistance protein CopA [Hyphomonas sp.]
MRSKLAGLLIATSALIAPAALADVYNLEIDQFERTVDGKTLKGISINGTSPGPLLRLREGEDVTINVTNTLDVDTSLHWHGIILQADMDGVPGISFDGIAPGETYTYNFTANQSGTYWYHGHSALQEQEGVFAPIIIEPAEADPFEYDREHVIILADWLNESPYKALANLKKRSNYYNYNRRTVFDLWRDWTNAEGDEKTDVIEERLAWGRMRMDPTDIVDISGYSFLVNGETPEDNWSGLFEPGEKVRLRFINAAAMTYFDVKIPGLKMTVVQADGQNIEPVAVDEFPIAIAETFDVIVEPEAGQSYTIFAAAKDRSGYARGTLSEIPGAAAEIPKLGPRPELTMAAMGDGHSDHGAMAEGNAVNMSGMADEMSTDAHAGHDDMSKMDHGPKVLSYADLRALSPYSDRRAPDREVELRLTGNMERYFWSINDVKFGDAGPLEFSYGERVRITFKNETMMEHPMHLHGLWMDLVNGEGDMAPRKHTITIGPGETISADVTVDATGSWAFHCHILQHAATGMFRQVDVIGGVQQ